MSTETAARYPIFTSSSFDVIAEQQSGKKLVKVETHDQSIYVCRRQMLTSYSDDLITLILKIRGPGYLCDEIARDEDPSYVRGWLASDLAGYYTASDFAGKRVLDFGCGSGASTVALRSIFPSAEIVGAELDSQLCEIARARARHYGFSPDCFLTAPDGEHLPEGIGTFDLVVLSAVWEHVLPHERPLVLRQIWSVLRPNGCLFINQTPYRWNPIENHTTGLPLLNYLPDAAAYRVARKYWSNFTPGETWQDLLRRGIRGGTPSEVVRLIRSFGGNVRIVRPSGTGISDSIDLWFQRSKTDRLAWMKKGVWAGLKIVKSLTGMQIVPSLTLVIQKQE